jgi:hypothetical protein
MDNRGLVVDFYVASKDMVSYSSNMGNELVFITWILLPCCGTGTVGTLIFSLVADQFLLQFLLPFLN